MKIACWNVNGLRSIFNKNTLDIFNFNFDIIALQETKAHKGNLSANITNYNNYHSYFASSSVRLGYSGVAYYTKQKPDRVEFLGDDRFDCEGRGLIITYQNLIIINCYFPNSQYLAKRLDYKLEFLQYLENKCYEFVNQGYNVILSGDYNIAPCPIDLTNPRQNEKTPGYFLEERMWMNNFAYKETSKFKDVYRTLYPNKVEYTWFDYKTKGRERNVGWRIDHFCVNNGLMSSVNDIQILGDIYGSDHVPVLITID